jgi:DNA-binding transcriptional LysR family regulator
MDPLSQDQLRAFAAVARTGNFTRAARLLHLSQPALSRRVRGLEEQLRLTLLVRAPAGVTPTEAGYRVLQFVQAQRALEEELLAELSAGPSQLAGAVRIAGLSSVVQPIALPALASFLREHPAVQIEIDNPDEAALGQVLARGAADFAISDQPVEQAGVVNQRVGEAEFVVIESPTHDQRNAVFLDTDASDQTTVWFFRMQPRGVVIPRFRRSFLHDEAGILQGVELGLGRAVKPRHTIPPGATVRVNPGFAPVSRPVYLQFRQQPFYTRLQTLVRTLLVDEIRRQLTPPSRSRVPPSRDRRGAGRAAPGPPGPRRRTPAAPPLPAPGDDTPTRPRVKRS